MVNRKKFETYLAEEDLAPLSKAERVTLDCFIDWLGTHHQSVAWEVVEREIQALIDGLGIAYQAIHAVQITDVHVMSAASVVKFEQKRAEHILAALATQLPQSGDAWRAMADKLAGHLNWFCMRVDNGEVRSKKTYAEFKEALAEYATLTDGKQQPKPVGDKTYYAWLIEQRDANGKPTWLCNPYFPEFTDNAWGALHFGRKSDAEAYAGSKTCDLYITEHAFPAINAIPAHKGE